MLNIYMIRGVLKTSRGTCYSDVRLWSACMHKASQFDAQCNSLLFGMYKMLQDGEEQKKGFLLMFHRNCCLSRPQVIVCHTLASE